MTEQDALLATISTLINRKAEGTYWDFKHEHHRCKADLIHDVLCLANARHTGAFECGLNCRYEEEWDMYICKETVEWNLLEGFNKN